MSDKAAPRTVHAWVVRCRVSSSSQTQRRRGSLEVRLLSESDRLMSRAFQSTRKLFAPQQAAAVARTPPVVPSRPRFRDHTRYAENDRVFIEGSHMLSRLLRADTRDTIDGGTFSHNDIIGKPLGPLAVRLSTNRHVRVTYPTLDEYISKTPRLVTPVGRDFQSSSARPGVVLTWFVDIFVVRSVNR